MNSSIGPQTARSFSESLAHFIKLNFGFPYNWQRVELILFVIAFILIFCSVELLFGRWRYASLFFPKPGVLLLIGVLFGFVSKEFGVKLNFFNEFFFFGILFPPLAFNASLDFKNLFKFGLVKAVALFGIIGSLLNFTLTGLSLFVVHHLGWLGLSEIRIKPLGFILFSSLLCSTDLAIVFGLLGKLRVHRVLYFLFIGESLLNDGVSISLFMMSNGAAISSDSYFNSVGMLTWISLAFASFFTQVLICALVGVFFGVFVCIISRWTEKEAALEPVIVFCLGYSGYILTYIFALPSTFYLVIFCTLLSNFSFRNLSHKSVITIRHFAQMVSAVADSMIFLYVGFSIATHKLTWHGRLAWWTLLFCFLWRFVVIYLFSFLANYFHWTKHKISPSMMFFISFGGFKGSVAHALAELVSDQCANAIGIPLSVLRCTVVFINLFSVLFIGITMAPLLRFYKFLSSEPARLSLFETLNERVAITSSQTIADIVGNMQGPFRSAVQHLYKSYMRPLLLRDPYRHDEIANVYKDIALAVHHASVATDKRSIHFHLRKLRPQLKKIFFYQRAKGLQAFALPLSHLSLHHLDLLSGDDTRASVSEAYKPHCQTSLVHRKTTSSGSEQIPEGLDLEPRSITAVSDEEISPNEPDWTQYCVSSTSIEPNEVLCTPRRRRLSLSLTSDCCVSLHTFCRTIPSSSDGSSVDEEEFRQMLTKSKTDYSFDEFAFAECFHRAIETKQKAIHFNRSRRSNGNTDRFPSNV